MSDDRERLERYLAWQRAQGKGRTARRRRWMARAGVAVLLGFVGAALVAWLVATSTHARSRVATGIAPAAPVNVAPLVEPAPAEPPRIAAPVPSPPATRPAPPAKRDARRRSAPPAPIQAWRVDSPEVAAAIAPLPQPTAPATPAKPPTAESEPPVTPPVPVAPEPGPTAAPDPSAVVAEPGPPASPPAPAAAATAPPKLSARVTGWLKGEVQEFRDGVKREIDDVRAGYAKLRRGVRQLRSKILEE